MTSRQILAEGVKMLARRPDMATIQNVCNLRIAASLTWQREEMGGMEHLQFALRNNTPIVPPGHCCHPVELVRRGFVDGVGWPKETRTPDIKLSQWPGGRHWYAFVDGAEVVEDGSNKRNTPEGAEAAAKRFADKESKP